MHPTHRVLVPSLLALAIAVGCSKKSSDSNNTAMPESAPAKYGEAADTTATSADLPPAEAPSADPSAGGLSGGAVGPAGSASATGVGMAKGALADSDGESGDFAAPGDGLAVASAEGRAGAAMAPSPAKPTAHRSRRAPTRDTGKSDDKATLDEEAPRIRPDRPRPVEIAEQQHSAGRLTAGEWRDLDNWSFWRALFTGTQRNPQGDWANMEAHWGFRTEGRVTVNVKRNGQPVVDAEVALRDAKQTTVWRARTDNRGQAHLYAGLFGDAAGPFSVEARSGAATARRGDITARGSEPLTLALAGADAPPNAIDVMFVVDTTGSMGDELAYLKAELGWVVTEVQKEHGQQLGVRTSVNFYRDKGDAYLVRPFAFDTNLDRVLGQIRNQSAGGGGDFPEAVESALEDAINKHEWSPRARARLLFLVMDAPPHHTPEILGKLHALTQEAARRGIRIIPLAGSGIDKPTEFLMRFLSVSTGGTYVFLTDHSGIGGGHIKPTIGKHEIYRLNDLLVRVIRSFLS